MLRVFVDQAKGDRYTDEVAIAVRGRPEPDLATTFEHQGKRVQVVPCESSLAVREALEAREDGVRLVVITDRDMDDLGPGILSHVAWHRVRTPDPWEAVQQRFAATGVDTRLLRLAHSKQVALGIIEAVPSQEAVAAPGGLVTAAHAFGSVTGRLLGLSAADDAVAVLEWSTRPDSTARLSSMRHSAGHDLPTRSSRGSATRSAPPARP